MNKCSGGCGFLAGIFLIVFTFVEWGPARWIIFAIGILMVLHSLGFRKCRDASCNTSSSGSTGEAIFLDKNNKVPSRLEISSTMKKTKVAKSKPVKVSKSKPKKAAKNKK